MPLGELSNEPDDIAKNVKLYSSYNDIPLATTGCDSFPAWHPKFKHLSPFYTIDELVPKLKSLLPNNKWTQDTNQDIHLILTGGEPLLGWQRSYIELLKHEGMQDLRNLTFETNATQTLTEEVQEYIKKEKNLCITWSCSPKLTVSGEAWEEAIQPNIVKSYYDLSLASGGHLYLKFVVANDRDIQDVNRAVRSYQDAGVICPVYLMPVGGTVEGYEMNQTQVAEYAMKQGWRFSPRLQVTLWGNQWGT